MKLQCFALLDIKTGAYGTPWFMRHGAEAMRAVGDLAQDKSTTVGRHPADYQLVCLGYWDDQSGAFENLAAPTVLGTAVSMIPEVTPLPGLFEPVPKHVGKPSNGALEA